jgi:hypothetical protein
MQNMVHYMTTSLRSNDTQLLQDRLQNPTIISPSERIRGTVFVQTQFVTVRWAWITLPGITLVLAIVFLAHVIVMTSKQSGWHMEVKSTRVIFYTGLSRGMDAATSIHRDVLTTEDRMQRAAEYITVQVAESDLGGIKIVNQHDCAHTCTRDGLGNSAILLLSSGIREALGQIRNS